MKKKAKGQQVSTVDLMKKERGSWGDVRPCSQMFKDKTKYTRKSKHKEKMGG